MPLSPGLQEATAIAAAEVLIEWLDAVIDDPAAAVDELGTTYQSYLSTDVLSEAEARARLADLAPWDPGADDGSHAGTVDRYAGAQLAAALDVARALIAEATGEGEVPAAVAPHLPALAPVVEVVRGAIAAGSFDEESVDLSELVAG